VCAHTVEGPRTHVHVRAQVHAVEMNHKPPETFADKLVLALVKILRFWFDALAGFKVRHVSCDVRAGMLRLKCRV
jgi:hypothetical protein